MKSILSLFLVAHFVLSHKYPIANPTGLKLKPPFLSLLDGNAYGAPIGICLKSKPKGKVTIFFEVPNFSSSKCKFEYTAKNWNVEQIMRVSPLPYLTPSDAKRVMEGSFLVVAPGEKFHKKRQKFQIIRNGGPGATCTIAGDPHFCSFAGRAFDFQGCGPYYLIKTPLLTVQQFNVPYGNHPPTVQARIAVRYHKTVYVFDGFGNKCNLASDANENVEIHTVPGVTWRVVLSDGTIINLTRQANPISQYMDVSIIIGTLYQKKVNGLCGLYELPANGNFIASNGAAVGDPNSFGHSWRVSDNDDLFTLGDKAACVKVPDDPQGGVGGTEICALPDPEELEGDGDGEEDLGKGEQLVKKAERLDLEKEKKLLKNELSKPTVPPKAAADEWRKKAEAKCKSILAIKEANDVLDPKIFNDDCIDDCVLSGTFDFVDDAKERYLAAVRRLIRSVLNEPAIRDGANKVADELKVKAKKASEKLGLGNKECPKDCSDKGICTANGCHCNEGFSGLDCSEENPENPGAKEAFTNKNAPPAGKVADAPQPKIMAAVKQAEKLEAENQAKKLKEAQAKGAKA